MNFSDIEKIILDEHDLITGIDSDRSIVAIAHNKAGHKLFWPTYSIGADMRFKIDYDSYEIIGVSGDYGGIGISCRMNHSAFWTKKKTLSHIINTFCKASDSEKLRLILKYY